MMAGYFPIVKNNLSPMSPRPGFIMPFSSTSPSQPPTQTWTPSSHSWQAWRNPCSVAKMLTTIMRFTPQSLRLSMAAEAVAPVAMTGSTMMASSDGPVAFGLEAVGEW